MSPLVESADPLDAAISFAPAPAVAVLRALALGGTDGARHQQEPAHRVRGRLLDALLP